jgi:hypothetical protein
MSELEPLAPELEQLFAEERRRFTFDATATNAMLFAIERAARLAPLGNEPPPQHPIPPTAPPTSALQHVALKSAAWKSTALVGLIAFSGGAAITETVHRLRAPHAEPTAQSIPAPSQVSQPPIAVSAAPTSPSATAPTAPAVVPTASAAPNAHLSVTAADPAPESTLARERELLETGRAALAHARPDDALAIVTTHAHEFPRGRLGEEYEVLAIQALRAANRISEADPRAARFHHNFPNSIYAAAVDAR